jgi:hypothetical protein
MKLLFHPYIRYKFVNSLFTGLLGGAAFTIYGSLSPSTFSLGGIVLALGLMGLAYAYHRLMKLVYFRNFSLAAEIIMLCMIGFFILFPSYQMTALIIYSAYQLSFIVGGYLVRAETHFARKPKIMGWIDVAKQQGYLAGLTLSYLFYKGCEHYAITEAKAQVYALHFPLLVIEVIVIVLLVKGFKNNDL